jgi:hypothetical protein
MTLADLQALRQRAIKALDCCRETIRSPLIQRVGQRQGIAPVLAGQERRRTDLIRLREDGRRGVELLGSPGTRQDPVPERPQGVEG